MAQWLGFLGFTAVAWVQFLVRELRSHKLSGVTNILKMIKILFYVFEDSQKCLRHHSNQSFDEMNLLS